MLWILEVIPAKHGCETLLKAIDYQANTMRVNSNRDLGHCMWCSSHSINLSYCKQCFQIVKVIWICISMCLVKYVKMSYISWLTCLINHLPGILKWFDRYPSCYSVQECHKPYCWTWGKCTGFEAHSSPLGPRSVLSCGYPSSHCLQQFEGEGISAFI